MKFITAAVFATALFVLVSAQVDMKCVEQHCKDEFGACSKEGTPCLETVTCITGCLKMTDPMAVQNCTNVCIYSHGDETFIDTVTCLTTNKCLTLPSNPSTCKSSSIKFQKNITVADVSGTGWRLRGYNKVYDCYPCQKVTISSTEYNSAFKAVLEDGSTKDESLLGTLTDNAPKPGFNVSIPLGFPWTFTFWVFDSVADGGNTYYLFYYCGSAAQWNYDGAFVYSSATSVSASAMTAISDSFKNNAGLDFSDFCTADMSGC